MVRFEFLDIKKSIKVKPGLKSLLAEIAKDNNKSLGEISIIFTSNRNILEINKRYLNHQYYTDVITFAENRRNNLSGDIYISVDQVKINSENYKARFVEELLRVIVHGILHLAGYNDFSAQEKKAMRKMEDLYICRFDHEVTILESEV